MTTRLSLSVLVCLAAGLSSVAGCGGSSGDSDSSAAIASGVFLDSAVEGASYQSGDISGITDHLGTFRYREGDMVQFRVGGILLGEAMGQPMITPADFVPGADVTHPTVSNITRFLLVCDNDGNPDNGIQITDNVRNLAHGRSIDFEQSHVGFEQDGNVQILVSELTSATHAGPRMLGPAADAQDHLMDTILDYHAGQNSGPGMGSHTGTMDTIFLDGDMDRGGRSPDS